VTKLRTCDGASLGTYAVGYGPVGVAFDGTNVWVSGEPITKLRASDGVSLGTFNVPIGSVVSTIPWRDRWNSVMELFMAGGNYAVAEVPFPKEFAAAVEVEIGTAAHSNCSRYSSQ
jgi:hypothetical protein